MAVRVGDDAAVAKGLMERGIAVNPIGGWGVPGYIRVSFGTDEENERFFAALREVVQQAKVAKRRQTANRQAAKSAKNKNNEGILGALGALAVAGLRKE